MKTTIRIGPKEIGDNQPLFVIAEVGVTCNYDMQISKELIDVVKDAGADAVKFIFWFPEELLSDRNVTFTYDTPDGGKRTENMFEMLASLRFTLEQWKELKQYAEERGVVLFSTVNTPSGVRLAEQIGLEAFKLSSWDYNYLPLWEELAAFKKPMLIDTGPVELLDVAKVMNVMHRAGNDEVVLLHCFKTSKWDEMNLRAIPYMRDAFGVLTGFSSTGQESEVDIVAVSLGACVLEKRLTMSRKLPGHHHALAKEPKEFVAYVAQMRDVHSSLGIFALNPSPNDLAERKKSFRRIVADRDIRLGTQITVTMLACKRPEDGGVSPEFLDLFIGRTVRRDIKADEPIQWSDLA